MQNATDTAWARWVVASAAVKAAEDDRRISEAFDDDEFNALVGRRRHALNGLLAAPIATLTDVARKLAVIAEDYDEFGDADPPAPEWIKALLDQIERAETVPEPA